MMGVTTPDVLREEAVAVAPMINQMVVRCSGKDPWTWKTRAA